MRKRELLDDIVLRIDRLEEENLEKTNLDSREIPDPILEIITPEWYFSESRRIFEDIDTSWENMDKADFIHNMAANLHKIDARNIILKGEFEKSFCSWYQAYHYLPRTNWGIHIRNSSWLIIAAQLYVNCPSLISKALESIKAAFLYLFTHEFFHYIIEYGFSIVEIKRQKPKFYTMYHSNIYVKAFNTINCIEESLANRFLFDKAQACHIDKHFLKHELLKQGDGYREFVNYLKLNLSQTIKLLISQVLEEQTDAILDKSFHRMIDTFTSPIGFVNGHRVPIWLHIKPNVLYE